MNGAFHVGGIGLTTQQRALDVIANNISNLNTQSFKRSDVRFSEIMTGAPGPAGPSASLSQPDNVAGVVTNVQFMLNEQGLIERTDSPLDIAVDGNGFLEVLGPQGQTLLWRGGRLAIAEDGMLMTGDGLPLKSMINIPLDADSILISPDGTVTVSYGNERTDEEAGRIMLVQVNDGTSLARLDGGLYRPDAQTQIIDVQPGADGAGQLIQGATERSNVDLNHEMVQMMIVQRAYAANAQVIQAADQISSITNNLRQ